MRRRACCFRAQHWQNEFLFERDLPEWVLMQGTRMSYLGFP